MKNLKIFEPAMCCESGVCGPNINPELLRITTIVNNLKSEGIIVDRFNLSSSPQEFINNSKISDILKNEGIKVLPITVLDNEVIKKSEYLTTEEFASFLDIPKEKVLKVRFKKSNACKCGGGCC